MGIKVHADLVQGSDAWLHARLGLITASEVKHILTPTLRVADNDKTRSHLYELLAQRVTKYVEPAYVSDDMLRGVDDELEARAIYHKRFAPVTEAGFITNDCWGFTIGYSPDGLVGDEGLIECKSRRAKYQVQTIIEWAAEGTPPIEYTLQCQTGMLVTERKWCDLISYSGGLPMQPMRIHADEKVQNAIIEAATKFEARLAEKLAIYERAAADLIPTERRIEVEMYA